MDAPFSPRYCITILIDKCLSLKYYLVSFDRQPQPGRGAPTAGTAGQAVGGTSHAGPTDPPSDGGRLSPARGSRPGARAARVRARRQSVVLHEPQQPVRAAYGDGVH